MNANTHQDWKNLANSFNPRSQAFIDGKFIDASDGATFKSINPANKKLLASISSCDVTEVNIAVKAARESYNKGDWSRRSPAERKKVMLKLAKLIEVHSAELALTDTLDMGKPISETMGFDLPSTIEIFQWTAESIDKIYGEIAPSPENALAFIRRESIGVIAAITPWNYPLMMASWKVAPALAAGNSLVLKPSEKSSLSALRLAELAIEAGVPKGVFNVVTGFGHTAGKALALHNDVDVLAFTGSTGVGKLLLQYAGQSNMKRVWLETGGKSPAIIFADCKNLEAAAQGAALGILNNQGETCIATSRLFVEESIKDEFLDLLLKEAKKYIPNDPLDPSTLMGPLVDEEHFNNVHSYIESGKKEADEPIIGDVTVLNNEGFFVSPTIFSATNADMKIVKEEIFGPVLAVDTFHSFKEAIDKANNTNFGLGAGIWTSDLNKAHIASRELEAGMVWVNNWGGGNSATPFGGIKQSGNGRDKSLHSLEKYTELKSVWIALEEIE